MGTGELAGHLGQHLVAQLLGAQQSQIVAVPEDGHPRFGV